MSQVVPAVLVGALLAGCGGAPEASPPPSSTPTADKTSTSAPAQPQDALAAGRRGAGAFVEYYIEVLNYATATGDLKAARTLSSPSCQSCLAMLDAVEDVYRSGGSVEGGGWTPTLEGAVRAEDAWIVDVSIEFAPQTVVSEKGSKPEKYPGGESTASFTVKRSGEGWIVAETLRAS